MRHRSDLRPTRHLTIPDRQGCVSSALQALLRYAAALWVTRKGGRLQRSPRDQRAKEK